MREIVLDAWAFAVFVVVGIGLGAVIGFVLAKWAQRLQQGADMKASDKIRGDAQREAEHILREARVSARSEVLKLREECEHELKDRRRE